MCSENVQKIISKFPWLRLIEDDTVMKKDKQTHSRPPDAGNFHHSEKWWEVDFSVMSERFHALLNRLMRERKVIFLHYDSSLVKRFTEYTFRTFITYLQEVEPEFDVFIAEPKLLVGYITSLYMLDDNARRRKVSKKW